MEDDKDPRAWPDRGGERREEDDSLLVRWVIDTRHWWRRRAGFWSKTLSAASALAGLVVLFGSAGAGCFALYAQWEGLPDRVGNLEARFTHHRDSISQPALRRLRTVEDQVDSLNQDMVNVQETMDYLGDRVGVLVDMAEWNNCLLRVQAGEISRFECGPDGENGR